MSCHPERSPAKSETIRQTQSKDPYHSSAPEAAGNFRITVRFIEEQGSEAEQAHEDEQKTKHSLTPSREAAEWESPARQCRIDRVVSTESRRDGIPEPNDIQ
jgi:hypothetical protein